MSSLTDRCKGVWPAELRTSSRSLPVNEAVFFKKKTAMDVVIRVASVVIKKR